MLDGRHDDGSHIHWDVNEDSKYEHNSLLGHIIDMDGWHKVSVNEIEPNIRSMSWVEKDMGLPLLESFHYVLGATNISKIY